MNLKNLKKKLKWLDPFTYVDEFLLPKINPQKNELIDLIVYLVSAFIFAWLIYSGLGILFNTNSPMVIVVSGSMEPVMYRGDVIILFGSKAADIKAKEVSLDREVAGIPMHQLAKTFCSSTTTESENLLSCDDFIKKLTAKEIQNKDFSVKKIEFQSNKTIDIDTSGDTVVYWSNILQQPIIHRAVAKVKAKDGTFLLTKGDSVNNPLLDQQSGIQAFPISEKDIHGKAVFKIPLLGYVKLILLDDLQVLLFGCKNHSGCPLP